MEIMDVVTSDQQFYETMSWLVIIGISCVFGFYSYLMCRLARITERQEWRRIFYGASVVFFCIGIWRMAVAFVYFENYTAKLTFPITAAISWAAIAIVGYLVVRWVEQAKFRMTVSQTNLDLSEAVAKEIIEPILRGELPSKELIAEHKERSMAFAQGLK